MIPVADSAYIYIYIHKQLQKGCLLEDKSGYEWIVHKDSKAFLCNTMVALRCGTPKPVAHSTLMGKLLNSLVPRPRKTKGLPSEVSLQAYLGWFTSSKCMFLPGAPQQLCHELVIPDFTTSYRTPQKKHVVSWEKSSGP